MKLNEILKSKDKTENIANAPEFKHKELKGSIMPHKGHTLFEYNVITTELTEAKFFKKDIDFKDAQKGLISENKSVAMKKDCIYISALNKKNALKKIEKKKITI